MKTIQFIILFFLLIQVSCTKEDTLFEESVWWHGHWQNIDEPSLFFSVGFKPIGINKIQTPQFFISTRDSIEENFYMEYLVDSNHNKKMKLIKTSQGSYIKIHEIDMNHIEVYGPSNTVNDLESKMGYYMKLPDSVDPPFSESILDEI